jgi:hypothetical protein
VKGVHFAPNRAAFGGPHFGTGKRTQRTLWKEILGGVWRNLPGLAIVARCW